MKKKIFMFSRDPGGTNTLIPLVRPLQQRGHDVELYGKDVALSIYRRDGLSAINIAECVHTFGVAEISEFIIRINPDLMITGTSIEDFMERYLWKASEKLAIPSFAMLDQWINYGIRFSRYGAHQSDTYRNDKTHPFLPTKILVMDEIAKREAIKDGLEPSLIEITGQPHFEALKEKVNNITESVISRVRQEINVGADDFVITFASEPVSVDYRDNTGGQPYWGFTEKTIFGQLVKAVESVADEFRGNISIVIKLHPREDNNSYVDEIDSVRGRNVRIVLVESCDSYDLIASSDLVCGMSSMFLIEAVVVGKPVLSVVIGLNRENPFILDRIGLLKSVLTKEELEDGLKSVMVYNTFARPLFGFIENPIERTIGLLERYT